MKAQPPVLTVKALRERRAQDAAQLARVELQRCLREEQACRQRWQHACERSLAQHAALGRFAGGADELLAAEAQWRASLHAEQQALAALQQADKCAQAAEQRRQRRVREWGAAREAFRLACEHLRRQAALAQAIRLGAEEEDIGETRAVVLKTKASHVEV